MLFSSFRCWVVFLGQVLGASVKILVLVLSLSSVGFFVFEFLDASFSSLGCFVFEFYVHHFRILRDFFFEFKAPFVFEFSLLLINDSFSRHHISCVFR